ncbi:MAG: hypothetical protein ACFCVH_03930 [Alphaproteobacteria bacterium]
MSYKSLLRSTTALPSVVGIGLAFGGYALAGLPSNTTDRGGANPEALPGVQLAQATPCGVVGDDGVECFVPRLREAAEANPDAAAGGSPCNPCNPCAGGAVIELTPEEAAEAYACARELLQEAYRVSGDPVADAYADWDLYNTAPYLSALHGSRYVNNYGNAPAESYGDWEDGGPMPVGAILAKDSFVVGGDGTVGLGPLFLMEKMDAGFHPDSDDWKYSMILPDGNLFGVTNGVNSNAVEFCAGCHVVAPVDHMYFLPPEFRVGGN